MTSSYLETLFYKHYTGTCTPEEEAALMELARQPANQDELKLLFERVWDKPATDVPFPAQSADAIFSTILQAGKRGKKVYTLPARRRFTRLVAAASVIVIIAAGILLIIHTRSANQKDISVQHDVAPGGNKAVLTLADGSRIVLDSIANGAITQQGNTKVTKAGSGQLAYNNGITNESNQRRILFNTLTIPRGGQYQLTLPDGTKVWLNAASSIHYPMAFPGKERHVELTGEAYFEVAPKKNQPFSVGVDGMNVQVLGTEFDIMAYPEEGNKKTTLVQGAVKIQSGKETRQLRVGEQAIVSAGGALSVEPQVNVESVIAWKLGFFQFRDMDLKTIMRQIARWYDVDIVYRREDLSGSYGGRISRKLNLSELTGLLEGNSDGHFKIEGRKLIVQP